MATIADRGEGISQLKSQAESPFATKLRGSPFIPLVVIAGFLPLVFWHLVELLQKPEYQYLVLLPLAAWALSTIREAGPIAPRKRPLPAMLLAVISCVGGLAAAWFWSPWLGAVSALIAVIPCLWWTGGWKYVREWLPVWVLCWLIIRLPFGWDQRLVQNLRTVTTRLASGVLDELGILQLSYANVIELPGKPLFVADACSGINSLHVLLGAALFLGLWFRRRALHIVALLAATFGIVLIENVSRLVTVAAGFRWKVDLSEGAKHATLGYVLFAISLLLVISTDQLLVFLIPLAKSKQSPATTATSAIHRSLGASFVRQILGAAWAAAAVVVGALSVTNASMPHQLPAWSTFSPSNFDMPKLGEDFLPKELAGFKFDRHSEVKRVFGDPFGQASQQWIYRRGEIFATVSIDYPYDGYHDLTECYTAIGWVVPEDHKELLTVEQLPAELTDGESGTLAIARMSQELFGSSLLLFSLVDRNGVPAASIKSKARATSGAETAADRLKSFGNRQPNAAPAVRYGGPYVQFQLFATSPNELTDEDRKRVIALYLAARKLLLPKGVESLKEQSSSSPPAPTKKESA